MKFTHVKESVMLSSVVMLFMILVPCCQQTATELRQRLTKPDTIAVLQTILNDKPLDTLIKKVFTNEQLKLVAGKVVKQDYNLRYKGKPVPILLQDSTLTEPHYTRPLRLNIRIPTFKANKDTVQVFIIFGSTNRTARFWFVNKPSWRVAIRQFGQI